MNDNDKVFINVYEILWNGKYFYASLWREFGGKTYHVVQKWAKTRRFLPLKWILVSTYTTLDESDAKEAWKIAQDWVDSRTSIINQ